MGLIGLQKGYFFLRCMYILKMSKLLEGRGRKKKRCITLNQLLRQPPQTEHTQVFPHSDVGLGGQHHAGRTHSFLCFIQMSHSFSEHTSFFFFFFLCLFSPQAAFWTCFHFSTPATSGGFWVLCLAVSSFTRLLLATISGSFHLEKNFTSWDWTFGFFSLASQENSLMHRHFC